MSSPFFLKLSLAFTTFTTIWLLFSSLRSPPPGQDSIVHIVMFQYYPNVTIDTKRYISSEFLALKDTCLRDGSKYIQSIDGGLNNSIEGKTMDMEHAYVVMFRSADDRNYYVKNDTVHAAFGNLVKDEVSKVLVYDFESGNFTRMLR